LGYPSATHRYPIEVRRVSPYPWVIAAAALLGIFGLAGCVSNKPAVPPHAIVLFSVVLRGDFVGDRQPTGLIVTLDNGDAIEGKQFAFNPSTRIPGNYTRFLVRLDLPGGSHRLTGLSGVRGNGVPTPEFDVVLDRPFATPNRETDYLGHFELSYGRPGDPAVLQRAPLTSSLVLADAYEDDFPEFVRAWPTLRRHAVARRAPPRVVSVETNLRNGAALEQAAYRNEGTAVAVRLDATAAAGLPPQAQAAFRAFLKSAHPRAFAVGASGDSGMAVGGRDVIERAVSHCRRTRPAAHEPGCHLFALDDTLVAQTRATSGAKPSK
jgi:hypothetical protein